jgi:hypothetical protein
MFASKLKIETCEYNAPADMRRLAAGKLADMHTDRKKKINDNYYYYYYYYYYYVKSKFISLSANFARN